MTTFDVKGFGKMAAICPTTDGRTIAVPADHYWRRSQWPYFARVTDVTWASLDTATPAA